MARGIKFGAAAAGACLIALYVGNGSAFAPPPNGDPRLLAHRGVHQTFSHNGLSRDTCTADRIDSPTNPYLENTLPSMAATFAAGATALELDIHPTTDGQFAVFHDYRLECRTNGTGVTRGRPMTYLKTLDVGYGYTADGGRTFPFRGKGVGLMPTLDEVLKTFPAKRFLINIKSNDPGEADKLITYLTARRIKPDGNLWIFADKRPRDRLRRIAPRARVVSKIELKACSKRYVLEGWSGHIPDACKGRFIAVPTNLAWLFWGWPNRFIDRMRKADVEIWLVGPVGRRRGDIGVEDAADLSAVPHDFPGLVLTDSVERIGPAMKKMAN